VNGWLLDTNILSELAKPRPEPRVARFMARQDLATLHVSMVTFAEIRYGITRVEDQLRRARLTAWLDNQLRPLFDRRILPITEDIMVLWRIMVAAGRAKNHTFSQPDLIIAATGLHHGLTVVTRDTADFDRAGVPVLNPWTAKNLA
jgi:predicted nucleic acid-binding protein